jgi:hypothetical protein
MESQSLSRTLSCGNLKKTASHSFQPLFALNRLMILQSTCATNSARVLLFCFFHVNNSKVVYDFSNFVESQSMTPYCSVEEKVTKLLYCMVL